MLLNSKLQSAQQSQTAIDDIIAQYESVISLNFQKRERKLIQELFQEAKQKKRELAFFKKNLSQQNLERLISQRRRQKQKQRESLESRWRECNESYKKLQQEQKRLISQHKENLYDAKKLEEKIKEFQSFYTVLQETVENLQNEKQIKFVTETQEGYRSPYKRRKDLNEYQSNQRLQKLSQSDTKFFSDKYSLDKDLILKPQAQLKKLQKTYAINKTSTTKIKIQTLNACKYPKKYFQQKEKQNVKEELFKFILSPKIKKKIFQILHRSL